eukprot:12927663-Prorocentrum_lima.AAC.1
MAALGARGTPSNWVSCKTVAGLAAALLGQHSQQETIVRSPAHSASLPLRLRMQRWNTASC